VAELPWFIVPLTTLHWPAAPVVHSAGPVALPLHPPLTVTAERGSWLEACTVITTEARQLLPLKNCTLPSRSPT
jgi:hypothetical protein